MTAGIRIYDPDTGAITLDTTEGLTRIVKVIDGLTESGTFEIPEDVIGGGKLFWYPVDQFSQNLLNFATISGRTVTYKKAKNAVLIIGVYA